jgi:molybdopterin-guanine dinucleotide biosynthesis protein MobB
MVLRVALGRRDGGGMIEYPRPVIGLCAFSGTGKTTLLARLLPLLRAASVRVAVIKHAHHGFDIDQPGKDSHTLRQAGAEQVLVVSRTRMAWIRELGPGREEPHLGEALAVLDPATVDLVLVEGFKREAIPKIEVHRPILGKPLMFPDDPTVIAVATDTPLGEGIGGPPRLDLNRPDAVAGFILARLGAGRP